ncbi:glycosyltransferase, partial [Pontibacterium sp.]|uniref:glycosyltransferase n=1 Tax=Pontibacterium sp. TaxID=2036026 RepID=UPI0035118796
MMRIRKSLSFSTNREGEFIPVDGSVLAESVGFNPIVLIPVYNHEEAIGHTLEEVLQHNCPVLLVDDGSSASCRDTLIE